MGAGIYAVLAKQARGCVNEIRGIHAAWAKKSAPIWRAGQNRRGRKTMRYDKNTSISASVTPGCSTELIA